MKNKNLILFGLLWWILLLALQIGIGIPWLFSQDKIPFLMIICILALFVYANIMVFQIVLNTLRKVVHDYKNKGVK